MQIWTILEFDLFSVVYCVNPCIFLVQSNFMIDMALLGPKEHISRGLAFFDPPTPFHRGVKIDVPHFLGEKTISL